MKARARISLAGQIRLGFTALILVAVALVGLNVAEMLWVDYTQDRIQEQEDRTRVVSQMMSHIDSLDQDITYVREAVTQGASVSQLQASFEAEASALSDLLDGDLRTGTASSQEEEATLDDLSSLVGQFRQAADDVFTAARQGSTQLSSLLSTATSLSMQIGSAAVPYSEDTMALLAAKRARLGFITNLCLILTAVLGALAVAGGSLVGLGLARKLRRTLRAAVSDISNSATELMAVSSQVASGAAQTAASTSETTATVEEVKQTAMLAQEKASAAAEGATGAVENIGSARELSEETAAGIQRMLGQMDVVFETINTLSERAQAAGDIVASVNDLAEQSNLLSVNASIEAAKAGEYGKGFTVVAQEVKSLAEQSKQAVDQVRTMLGEIQKASQTAVEAATQSREAVEAGRQKSVEAGQVMQRVAEGARDDADSSRQAVASAQQVLAGMEQIAKAIESIDQAGTQSVSGTRQVEQEVARLQELAVDLRRLVEADKAEVLDPDSETAAEAAQGSR